MTSFKKSLKSNDTLTFLWRKGKIRWTLLNFTSSRNTPNCHLNLWFCPNIDFPTVAFDLFVWKKNWPNHLEIRESFYKRPSYSRFIWFYSKLLRICHSQNCQKSIASAIFVYLPDLKFIFALLFVPLPMYAVVYVIAWNGSIRFGGVCEHGQIKYSIAINL